MIAIEKIATTPTTGKEMPRPLRRISHRHSAAGEPIGTARADPGSATIRKCVGLTLQGSYIEFAGVAHGLRSLGSVWVGNGDTAAGQAVGTGRAHRRGATIRKRMGLTLQRTSRESTGMTHAVSCKSSAQQKHTESQVFHKREAQNSDGPICHNSS